jgi:hypothetical protein
MSRKQAYYSIPTLIDWCEEELKHTKGKPAAILRNNIDVMRETMDKFERGEIKVT